MIITGYITGQRFELRQPYVVAESIDYLTADFVFQTSDWAGRSIWAHFEQSGKSLPPIMLENGKISADKHLNLGAGTWEVWLHGTGEDGSRITTNIQLLTVEKTGTDGEPLEPIAPSPAEQIDAKSQQALNRASEALEAAQQAEPAAQRAQQAAEQAQTDALTAATAARAAREQADRAQDIVDNFTPGGGGGTADHSKLYNRSKPDQHPIEAITGLQEALDGKAPSCDDTQAGAAPWSGKKVQEAIDSALAIIDALVGGGF